MRRRDALKAGAALVVAGAVPARAAARPARISQFDYGDVELLEGLAAKQLRDTAAALLAMDEEALLRPFRERAGMPIAAEGLGGWYDFDPTFVPGTQMNGFIPGHSLGQYISSLARAHAVTRDPAMAAKARRLNKAFGETLRPAFFEGYPLPAYTYDKMLVGLIDAHLYANDPEAKALIGKVTDIAAPFLPDHALTRPEMRARPHPNEAFTWDESYTLPENLYRAWEVTGDARFRTLARAHLHDKPYFDPVAAGENKLPGEHAYSHVNAFASAIKAWEIEGDPKHLTAAKNGMRFVEEQSYATGGWGPNETFVQPGQGKLGKLLAEGRASFETPCGCYGHFKVARGLIRNTGESRWGDAMERLLFNASLGVLPLQSDGTSFYYSNYHDGAKKEWYPNKCPCCSGTLGQLAADYGISAYLRDEQGVYVNLYLPSKVTWRSAGKHVEIRQETRYPFAPEVHFTIRTARPAAFALRLRIPEWSGAATALRINGRPAVPGKAGQFTEIVRTWHGGDKVTLTFDMPLRLEPVDAQTPDRVALVHGPLALFQTGADRASFTRAELLAAKPQGDGSWRIGGKPFQPFTAIAEGEPTRLYQIVTG